MDAKIGPPVTARTASAGHRFRQKETGIANVLDGREEGTFFVPWAGKLSRAQTLDCLFHHPKGSLWVDDGARNALRDKGKSRCLGVRSVSEILPRASHAYLRPAGTEFSRGISRFDADEIRAGN